MKNRNRGRRDGKGIYIVLLVMIAGVLVFAIGLLMNREDEPNVTESLPEPSQTTAPLQTTVLTTEQTLPETTTMPVQTIPVQTIPVETIPAETNTTDTVSAEYGHIYIRVNHEKPLEPPEGFGADTAYRISDDNIAYVDADNMLIGLEKGECILTAESGGKTAQIPVTVRELSVEDGCTYVDGILVANKSYSLPRDYDPGLLPVTEEAFEKLSADAAKEGLNIQNSSDYRTYDFQEECYVSIVNGYSKEYADSISARPGHSEHQTGYTIDCNSIDNTFADTAEGKWLAENCWKYGFIIRYPEDKVDLTGYAYESWHIRYVGVEHAKEIWEQGICLEEYLDIDSKYAE